MGKFELIALAVGLSMDALSVAVCKGLSMKKLNYKGGIHHRAVFRHISGAYASYRLLSRKSF